VVYIQWILRPQPLVQVLRRASRAMVRLEHRELRASLKLQTIRKLQPSEFTSRRFTSYQLCFTIASRAVGIDHRDHRFIDSQLKLEADAREALPYVRLPHPAASTLLCVSNISVEVRYLHKAAWPSSTAPFCLFDVQPSRIQQSRRCLLLMLSFLPWRTYLSRALQ
jgi:hypothetical protein